MTEVTFKHVVSCAMNGGNLGPIDCLRMEPNLAEVRHLGKDDYFWREGETSGVCLAFLAKGRIKALKNNEFARSQIVLGLLVPGAVIGLPFGENATPRRFTLQAVEDCELLQVSENTFEAIIRENPPLAVALLRHIHSDAGKKLAGITDRVARFF